MSRSNADDKPYWSKQQHSL